MNANEIAPTDLNDIQVAFLDIDMPEISGLEFRKKYNNIPVCIFTAHPEHAAESFELDTLDFIIKPIKQERFQKTAHRIESFLK
jgi:DNA-binding LytR/AlgR family response regulator